MPGISTSPGTDGPPHRTRSSLNVPLVGTSVRTLGGIVGMFDCLTATFGRATRITVGRVCRRQCFGAVWRLAEVEAFYGDCGFDVRQPPHPERVGQAE
jgi:hypothetical protein